MFRYAIASSTAKAAVARELAADPFVVPDLRRVDEDGREIGDILIDDFLFSYWVDHPAKVVMIVDVADTL